MKIKYIKKSILKDFRRRFNEVGFAFTNKSAGYIFVPQVNIIESFLSRAMNRIERKAGKDGYSQGVEDMFEFMWESENGE